MSSAPAESPVLEREEQAVTAGNVVGLLASLRELHEDGFLVEG